MVTHIDPKKVDNFQHELLKPPDGRQPSDLVAETEGRDFVNFAAAFGVSPPKDE